MVCNTDFGPKVGTTHSYDCNAGEWLRAGTTIVSVDAECVQCPALGVGAATDVAGGTFGMGSLPSAEPGATATIAQPGDVLAKLEVEHPWDLFPLDLQPGGGDAAPPPAEA